MKKIILSTFIFFGLISCKDITASKKAIAINKVINNELSLLDIQATVTTSINDAKTTVIEISLKKPYRIIEPEHQTFLDYYLDNKVEKYLGKEIYAKYQFIYKVHLDSETGTTVTPINDVIKHLYNFNDESFQKLAIYCLKDFEGGDVTKMIYSLENIKTFYSKVVEIKPFFFLLADLSRTKESDVETNANSVFLLMYFFTNEMMKENKDKKYQIAAKEVVRVLSDLWFINYGSVISKEESRFWKLNKSLLQEQARLTR